MEIGEYMSLLLKKALRAGALLLGVSLISVSCQRENQERSYSIIPQPNEMTEKGGSVTLRGEVRVALPENERSRSTFLYLKELMSSRANVELVPVAEDDKSATIQFSADSLPSEAYGLEIGEGKIRLTANADGAGFFYAVQTLSQLMPYDLYERGAVTDGLTIPAVSIKDRPRFPYRGAMIDVGRNFMPKEFVLKFIDQMALYKMNRLHFHLTDDQGWRIEIKKYPRLTEVGSKRGRTLIGHSDYYWPRRYDTIPREGYYTQEEIKEIVKYAQDRFITVIPEIEMPGHASAALAAYPEFSCGLGKKYVVRDYWDIFDEVFCPTEKTIAFLEDVLSEVMELFPSHYIHIGGDECPKKAWKKCAHCQALMKREGLKSEEELQSWFIHRIEKFVNGKGRDIIGWDEILEGGLAPNATVLSWRGEKGGIEAARMGHNVIMAPGQYCYYDHYQESPEFAPLEISGFLPLDTAYAYEPLPKELTEEERKYIIGPQANIWGEYIQTPEYLEYMAFPRLLAMAEIQWTYPERKDFEDFTHRLAREFRRLDYNQVNACRNFYEVNFSGAWNAETDRYEVTMKTFCPGMEIRYALNDSTENGFAPYDGPVFLDKEATVYAAAYLDGERLGKVTHKTFAVNAATGCDYTCTPEAGWEHLNKGFGLTDGVRGYSHHMRRWISFYQDTVRIDVRLREGREVSQVAFASLWRPWDTIWPARHAKVSLSEDGVTYQTVKECPLTYDFALTEATRFPVTLSFEGRKAAFVRLELLSGGPCPKGYFNAGEQSELALDEIEIQ